jgi:hypothetical protein
MTMWNYIIKSENRNFNTTNTDSNTIKTLQIDYNRIINDI